MYGYSRRAVVGSYAVVPLKELVSRLVLEVYDVIDSTMDAEPPPGFEATGVAAVAAASQRRGRGRTGAWYSPPGGVWVTVVLREPPLKGVSVAVGGCLAKALEKLIGKPLQVKWPNDVYASGRKLAGVLVEYRGGVLRIGVGVNVYNPAPGNAVSLASLGYHGPLALVLFEVVHAVIDAVRSRECCIAEASKRNLLKGCIVEADTLEGVVRGVAGDILGDGALELALPDGTLRLYCCGIKSYSCRVAVG